MKLIYFFNKILLPPETHSHINNTTNVFTVKDSGPLASSNSLSTATYFFISSTSLSLRHSFRRFMRQYLYSRFLKVSELNPLMKVSEKKKFDDLILLLLPLINQYENSNKSATLKKGKSFESETEYIA